MEWINELGKAAASLTAIIGLITLVLFRPIKRSMDTRKRERQEERDFRVNTSAKLNSIGQDIADIQCDRLSQAYDHYVYAAGWCPDGKKRMLTEMFRSYKSKGRNHLTERYIEDIMALPDRPLDGGTN